MITITVSITENEYDASAARIEITGQRADCSAIETDYANLIRKAITTAIFERAKKSKASVETLTLCINPLN